MTQGQGTAPSAPRTAEDETERTARGPDATPSGGRGEARARMLDEVVEGLSSQPKTLPSKYFYDEAGSKLFDEITELDEYYLTRTETGIMQRCASEIAEEIGPGALIVEPGSGSSVKTRILLDHVDAPAGYVPVDISGDYLVDAAEKLCREHPGLSVLPLVADFTEPMALPSPPTPPRRTVVYFPGSTIGNFPVLEATRLLKRLRSLVGPEGAVLIGFDLAKDVDVLEAAYDDARGVTARFNLNVLAHINSELDADFDLDAFEHRAPFNAAAARIEMYLVSRRAQRVHVDGHCFTFARGEPILTEYSHKYTLESFADLAGAAGLVARRTWTDPDHLFCVQMLEPSGG
ncbi:MAG: L-histidine N(alpha)-methyltransferase [Gemmatimonadota bacterium]